MDTNMYFEKTSTINNSTSTGENIRRIDNNDMFTPESPGDDADALLPSNPRPSDERVTKRILWSNDKCRAIILKMLLLIGTIFLGVLALIIILLAVASRRGPNHSISTAGLSEISMTAIGMGDDISLNQHIPDAGSVGDSGGIEDDHHEKHPSGAQYLMKNPCGHSAAEARARGCRYGMVNSAWLPNECYDEETEERFKQAKNWEFWRQPNKTGLITWEEAAKGEFDLMWAEWDHHVHHCTYLYWQFFRAVAGRGLLSVHSDLAQVAHMDHCARMVADSSIPRDVINTRVWRTFPDCGLLHW